jgi:ABC-type phosphate transport system permease subunit
LYAAAAFGLFAVQTLVEFLEDLLGVGTSYAPVVTASITLAILVLFFLAIVSKGTNQ